MIPTAAAVASIAARLAAAGIEDPRREARILIGTAYGIDAAQLLALPEIDMARLEPFIARRAAREPLAYISGRREFWGLEFLTAPSTLIPRPDSETLVEAALARFPARDASLRVLDLGTGTGCLLLAVLHERPNAHGIGIDLSPDATRLAARNAARLNLADRASFLAGSWAEAITGGFDLILSNPPYIPDGEIPGLMPEVALHEPEAALDGGPDGLDAYRHIIGALPRILRQNGVAILELGAGQTKSVSGFAADAGFATSTRRDLSGQERALMIKSRLPV